MIFYIHLYQAKKTDSKKSGKNVGVFLERGEFKSVKK